jgi:isoleucyl-tRNA synthetase
VNVRRLEIVAADTELVRLKGKANFRTLGKRYGKRTPEVAGAAARLDADQLHALEHGEPALLALEDGTEVTYLPEDVVVEREVASDWLVQSDGPFVVALDPRLDDGLRAEGLAREVVNRVQRLRREAGYAFTDRIELWVDGDRPVLDAVGNHAAFLQEETLTRGLRVGERAPYADLEQTVQVEEYTAVLAVRRHGTAT